MLCLKKSEWLAIPNLISIFRILLIPVFIYTYFEAETKSDYLWSAVIVLFSGFTDYLDGVIARRCEMITDLGKLLDPVADKLTQLAIVFCLVITWEYMWIIVSLFIVKELSLLLCNILLYRQGRMMDGALWYGKVATFTFYGCALFLVAFPTMKLAIANLLMLLTASTLLMAFIMYTRWFIIQLRADSGESN